MEVRTFQVKFNRRSTAETAKLGEVRFEFESPVFRTFADLDLEALRDWIGETYEGVDAEKEVLKLLNGAIKDYARQVADPTVAVAAPKVYERLSAFVAALVAAPSDDFRERLCALNAGWAVAVAGVSGLVSAPAPVPVPSPGPGKGGKRR